MKSQTLDQAMLLYFACKGKDYVAEKGEYGILAAA